MAHDVPSTRVKVPPALDHAETAVPSRGAALQIGRAFSAFSFAAMRAANGGPVNRGERVKIAMRRELSCIAPIYVAVRYVLFYLGVIGIKTGPGGLIHRPV